MESIEHIAIYKQYNGIQFSRFSPPSPPSQSFYSKNSFCLFRVEVPFVVVVVVVVVIAILLVFHRKKQIVPCLANIMEIRCQYSPISCLDVDKTKYFVFRISQRNRSCIERSCFIIFDFREKKTYASSRLLLLLFEKQNIHFEIQSKIR